MSVNDPKALLRRLLKEPSETEWLEFKLNNSDPDEIGRCISACSNSAMLAGKERAYIIWGVEDKTKKKIGTTFQLRQARRGAENFINWLSHVLQPNLMMEFLDFTENGKKFAILVVEQTYDRPVRFLDVEYIRVGENIKKLRDFPDHERSLWLVTARHRFEEAIALSHQSANAILTKLDVDAFYRLSRAERPQNQDEILRKLSVSHFTREDGEGGYDITNLGAILFAKNIGDFATIASKPIRVVKYGGLDKRDSESELEEPRGYAVAFSKMIQYVIDRVPTEEKYLKGVRTPVPVLPEIAIREVIANALIHQDFTISGAGPLIEIYSNRIEVTNPGNSLIAQDRMIDDRASRNEKLASAMRSLGLCEERGGGIDKALIELEEKSLPALEFFPSANSMRVVLFGPEKFGDLSREDKVWSCFCHCVIRWLKHDYMSNTSLRKRFSLPDEEYQAVSAVISDAKKRGRIVPAEEDQGKRNARYVPYWVR